MTWILAAKLPLSTLLSIAAIGGLVLLAWSYSHWRAAVKLALVIALFEGAIRKWVWAGGQELVYFLKDGVLLGAYLRFFLAPDPDIRAFRLFIPTTLILVSCAIVSAGALNPNIGHPAVALVGVKIYFYYIPLAFMVPYLFRTQGEMIQQLTRFAWISIPICALGFLQWGSDGFSVINTYANREGVADTGATTLGIEGVVQRVRITGTFSYISGHTTFVSFFMALVLVLLSLKETRHKWVLLWICVPMLAGNALMSGSRAAVLTQGFVVAGFLLAAVGGKLGTSKNFVVVLGTSMLVCIVGGIFLFAEAWSQWSTRFKYAGDSVQERVFGQAADALTQAMSEAGVAGYGIGSTHAVTDAIRRTFKFNPPKKKAPFFDNELGQIMAELGFLGFMAWYVMRIAVLVTLWSSFLRSPPGILKSVSLAAFLIYGPYMVMSVVVNHTASILLWALVGLSFTSRLQPTVQRRFANPRARPGQDPGPLRGRRV
jgi:hypothetical protein